jgi:hypothetical protein
LLHHKPVPSEAYLSSFVKSKYFPATLVIWFNSCTIHTLKHTHFNIKNQ